MKPLSEKLSELVNAGFGGIYLQSFEHEDAIKEIKDMCAAAGRNGKPRGWGVSVWDADEGLSLMDGAPTESDPHSAIKNFMVIESPTRQLLILKNFHKFIGSNGSEIILQTMANAIHAGKSMRRHIIVLSAIVEVPKELETHFIVIEHDLPDRSQLLSVAEGLCADDKQRLPQIEAAMDLVLDASAGLTRTEAENAMALSIYRSGRIEPQAIWEIKSSGLKKSGLMELYEGTEKFDSLGGLSALKKFCFDSLANRKSRIPSARPRGVLLLGPPGTGKSAFAKALGAEVGIPILIFDVGAMMGSLLGQTEHNIRRALKIADAMSPSILFIDEVEKAMAGSTGSGDTDGGVKAGMLGTLLTWMNDHTSDVYVVCTANDARTLPPAFYRSMRIDGMFFIDIPNAQDRKSIWQIHMKAYEIKSQTLPDDEGWTGAEIRSCCRLASMLGWTLKQAATHVIPISITAREDIFALENWANNRCLDAHTGNRYSNAKLAEKTKQAKPGNRTVDLN